MNVVDGSYRTVNSCVENTFPVSQIELNWCGSNIIICNRPRGELREHIQITYEPSLPSNWTERPARSCNSQKISLLSTRSIPSWSCLEHPWTTRDRPFFRTILSVPPNPWVPLANISGILPQSSLSNNTTSGIPRNASIFRTRGSTSIVRMISRRFGPSAHSPIFSKSISSAMRCARCDGPIWKPSIRIVRRLV